MWSLASSPVGDLRLVATNRGDKLLAIEFEPFSTGSGLPIGERTDNAALLVETKRQLTAYFAKELTNFELPLAPAGTDFQKKVWAALQQIPYGTTSSYGSVAQQIGMTNAASRAIGLANGKNPIPIVVPCHRVIGADGSLTGYAGGLARKQTLLSLETAALF